MAIDMHTFTMKEVSIISVWAPKADFQARIVRALTATYVKLGRGEMVPCVDFSRTAEDRKYVRTRRETRGKREKGNQNA